MPLKLVFILLSISAVTGIAFGYFLRWIISLGQRGSLELRIKQTELQAKEDAKRITEEATKQAEENLRESRIEFKEREEKAQKTEDRLIKKEEFLDKRQVDIDKEVEHVKEKVSEVKMIKERAEELEKKRLDELQKISGLSPEDAKNILLAEAEKKFEEDIVVRLQKLENQGVERLETRAKSILTSSIHR